MTLGRMRVPEQALGGGCERRPTLPYGEYTRDVSDTLRYSYMHGALASAQYFIGIFT